MAASADGSSAFFTTRDQLVGQDQDFNIDVYAARVNGGFASQNPVRAGALHLNAAPARAPAARPPDRTRAGTASSAAPATRETAPTRRSPTRRGPTTRRGTTRQSTASTGGPSDRRADRDPRREDGK